MNSVWFWYEHFNKTPYVALTTRVVQFWDDELTKLFYTVIWIYELSNEIKILSWAMTQTMYENLDFLLSDI